MVSACVDASRSRLSAVLGDGFGVKFIVADAETGVDDGDCLSRACQAVAVGFVSIYNFKRVFGYWQRLSS